MQEAARPTHIHLLHCPVPAPVPPLGAGVDAWSARWMSRPPQTNNWINRICYFEFPLRPPRAPLLFRPLSIFPRPLLSCPKPTLARLIDPLSLSVQQRANVKPCHGEFLSQTDWLTGAPPVPLPQLPPQLGTFSASALPASRWQRRRVGLSRWSFVVFPSISR